MKGYSSSATISVGDHEKKSSLKWFFNRTVPFAKRYFKQESGQNNPIKAVFITSANFWDDGRDFVKKLNATNLKSKILNVAYERADLLKLLKENEFTNEVKIIEKYYTSEETEKFPNDDTDETNKPDLHRTISDEFH